MRENASYFAKGMVVTQNIETAIRYFQAIARLLEKGGTRSRH